MIDRIRHHVIRDTDDADRPTARVETIGDLVFVELHNRGGIPESILIHPVAARRIAAALILEAMRAELVGLAADCESDGKGGLL